MGHGKRGCTETVHVIGHQLFMAAHERYDEDDMFEMAYNTKEDINDFTFMNIGEVNSHSEENELGECNICGSYGPMYNMCTECEHQGGIYDGTVDRS
jgi:hypothetical protein